jgi:hypothetical protein
MNNKKQKTILILAILILITMFLGIPSVYQDIATSIFTLLIIATLFCKFLEKDTEIDQKTNSENESDFIESKPEFEEEVAGYNQDNLENESEETDSFNEEPKEDKISDYEDDELDQQETYSENDKL